MSLLLLFKSGAAAQTLTPSLYTNTQTFFAPTVSATYNLAPALFTNTQTFYSATVISGPSPASGFWMFFN